MNEFYNRPAIFPLISIIGGILIGAWLPYYKNTVIFFAILIFVLIVFFLFRQKKIYIFVGLLFTTVGYLLIQNIIAFDMPKNYILNHVEFSGKTNIIIGKISEPPVYKNNRLMFAIDTEYLEKKKGEFLQVTGRIDVSWFEKTYDKKISKGDRVKISGRLRRIRNFYNPKGFDYERYMAFEKIYARVYVYGDNLRIIEKFSGFGLRNIIDSARKNFSEIINMLPDEKENEKGVLKALSIGIRNEIKKSVADDFNNSGASHILAISGLHIGIIATISFFFFLKIFSYVPLLLEKGLTKKIAASFTILVIATYGLFAGMSPSTQRAVIMVTIFLCAFLFERKYDVFNTLAAAGLVILIIDPTSLFSVSFQLSFTAVFGICLGLKSNFLKNANKIYLFFFTSLFAIIATMPIVLYYFNTLCTMGFFTNIVAVPIIGFLVVPLELLSLFLSFASTDAALFLLKTSASILSFALYIIHKIAELPFSAFKTVTPNIYEICCYYALILSLFNLKRFRLAKIATYIALIVLSCDIAYWSYERFFRNYPVITVLDVGQGNAALLELPKGYTMLIDGGGFSDNSSFDVGAYILAPFLWKKKIRSIDTVVLSHPNSDHMNGLIYILKNFYVKNLWSNNEPASTKGYRSFSEAANKSGAENARFSDIYGPHIINGATLEIIYPPKNFMKKTKKENSRDPNNNSLVLRADFENFSIFFPGDIMSEAEKELIAMSKKKLESTIMIAPHHGSKSSSTEAFLNAVQPEIVIISCGFENKFGFPHKSVAKRYEKKGYKIFRTDMDGAIVIKGDGDSFSIEKTKS